MENKMILQLTHNSERKKRINKIIIEREIELYNKKMTEINIQYQDYLNNRRKQRSYNLTNEQKKINNERIKIKIEKNPKLKLNRAISSGIRLSLKGNKNGYHWESLVNYTLDDLKEHLENQFVDNMNWQNYGTWHIDHIIPQALWEFNKPEDDEFKQCWSLANLQPLWYTDNLTKGKRTNTNFSNNHLIIR